MIEIVTLTCPNPTGDYSMTLVSGRLMTVPGPALSGPRRDLEKLTLMIALVITRRRLSRSAPPSR